MEIKLPEINFVRYSSEHQKMWNDFVESSKNGTFLFDRAYMDYHSDRFEDFSLLIFRKEKLYCLLPANRKDEILFSHQGLTYGGLIMNEKCTAEGILEVFRELLNYLRKEGFKKFIYKPIPHLYHKIPSEEDLYALFRNNALLKVRNISSTIYLQDAPPLFHDRKTARNKALRNGIYIEESMDYGAFWEILKDNLWRTYQAYPVHSLEEMEQLRNSFPDNIKLYLAFLGNEPVAGCLIYLTSTAVHAQYISGTEKGKKSGGIDLLINHIMDTWRNKNNKLFFDLGTSNEDGGRFLNESLIYQKQGFGGRAICYDTYELTL